MAKVSQAHLEARRQSILAAATKVFSQKGFAAATMADIAQEAGISPGAIYRYFASKDELARDCWDDSAEAVKAAWLHPELVETDFVELSRATFEMVDRPGSDMDTRLFLERVLTALRDEDGALLAEHQADVERTLEGVAYLLRRKFGPALEGWDVRALAQALFSFYWGTRLMRLIAPGGISPRGQFEVVQALMAQALAGGGSAEDEEAPAEG